MSVIDKVLIKGIRCFAGDNKQVADFKPVTLFVGPNGVGKSTIVECLKVACTGELPRNVQHGHNFIGAPKVALKDTETKGQIRIRFKKSAQDLELEQMTCVKSYLVTQEDENTNIRYEALAPVLKTINPNTKKEDMHTYQFGDAEEKLLSFVGMSKAVVENVMFVQQDEVNWPLQDSSTLNKKLNDLLSTSRYIEALEAVKNVNSYKLNLDLRQTQTEGALKLRKCILQYQDLSESSTRQISDLEEKIRNHDNVIQESGYKLKDLQRLRSQIATMQGEIKSKSEELDRYLKIEGNDKELNLRKVGLDRTIATTESSINHLSSELLHDKDVQTLMHQINENRNVIAELQAAYDSHISLKNERDLTIWHIFRKLKLGSTPEPPFSEEVATNLLNQVQLKLNNMEQPMVGRKTNQITARKFNSSLQKKQDELLSFDEFKEKTRVLLKEKSVSDNRTKRTIETQRPFLKEFYNKVKQTVEAMNPLEMRALDGNLCAYDTVVESLKNSNESADEFDGKNPHFDNMLHLLDQINTQKDSVDSLLSTVESISQRQQEEVVHAPDVKSLQNPKMLIGDYMVMCNKINKLQAGHTEEIDILLEMTSRMKQYEDTRKKDELIEFQKKQIQLQSKWQTREARKKILELDKLRNLRQEQEKARRMIEEKLRYRAQVKELHHEIEKLEKEEKTKNYFETDRIQLSQERDDLLAELNKQRGMLSVYLCNIESYKVDLEQEHYRSIAQHYIDQPVLLKSAEMEETDLDVCYKTIDNELKHSHTTKLEAVNESLRRLWMEIYCQGDDIHGCNQDIYNIRIHSEFKGGGTYSYKVLMSSDGEELEMRGRCSAGQEAVASTVIRLALAESCNCNIIAFDEPTRNLDTHHAARLAAYLLRMMEHKNMQIIVTTHDEGFAKRFCKPQFAGSYYRLSKDDYYHTILEAQAAFG